MARKTEDIPGRIVSAALELAASDGWRVVSLSDIAAKAGVSLAELREAFSSKAAIVNGFFKGIDEKVLAGIEDGDETSSTRDRLFDILMRRFDGLSPHKAGVAAILRDTCTDPVGGLCILPRFLCSMAWMVEAAGLSSEGFAGMARTHGLALIYAAAFRVWLRDDTADSSATMAALDRDLCRAERMVGWCRFAPSATTGEGVPSAG
jgi:AcrR family transcriptional regulator